MNSLRPLDLRTLKPALTLEVPPRGVPLLRLGFRVFFFLAALWSCVVLLLWVPLYLGWFRLPLSLPPLQWHAREMVFGFATAVIAGFLLTAAGNWTSLAMPSGRRLGLLAALWMIGRAAPFFPSPVFPVLATAGLLFYPLAAWALFRPMLRTRQTRNTVFPALLLFLGAADLIGLLAVRNARGIALGTEAGLFLSLLVVGVMGGRVIPGFTQGRHPQGRTRTFPWVENLAFPLLALAALGHLAAVPAPLTGVLFALAGLAHFVRSWGWFTPEIRREPLLWILHASYFWLGIGLLLHSLSAFGLVNPLLPRHAFGAGVLGGLSLGMMCRVTLGHTGRPMLPRRGTTLAFGAILFAPVFRVLLPLFLPNATLPGLWLSALSWIMAYGIYLWQYAPMLFLPRVDGKAG